MEITIMKDLTLFHSELFLITNLFTITQKVLNVVYTLLAGAGVQFYMERRENVTSFMIQNIFETRQMLFYLITKK